MVKLRLRRAGRKKLPFYRIVAADSRAPRDGRYIELIGTYNPLPDVVEVSLQEDRVIYWLQNGAQPSATVKNLLQNKGIWLKWMLIKKGADEAKIAEEFAKWEVSNEEKMKRTALKKENAKKKKADKKAEPEETEETTVSEETETPKPEPEPEETKKATVSEGTETPKPKTEPEETKEATVSEETETPKPETEEASSKEAADESDDKKES